jgi:hypothetical protein
MASGCRRCPLKIQWHVALPLLCSFIACNTLDRSFGTDYDCSVIAYQRGGAALNDTDATMSP